VQGGEGKRREGKTWIGERRGRPGVEGMCIFTFSLKQPYVHVLTFSLQDYCIGIHYSSRFNSGLPGGRGARNFLGYSF